MIKLLLKYCLLFFLVPLVGRVNATHVAASEMTYTSRVINYVDAAAYDSIYIEFTFRLKVYRDCGGVALDPNYDIYYDYGAVASGSGPSGTFGPLPNPPNNHPRYFYYKTPNPRLISLTRISIGEVPLSCSSMTTQCTGGPLTGYEEHVYVGSRIIGFRVPILGDLTDFPVVAPTSGVSNVIRFQFDEYARNNTIDNLNSPGSRSLYNQTIVHVDRLVYDYIVLGQATNSSPTVDQPPIFYGCVNEPINFSNIVQETDGDSISYRLINPLETSNGTPLVNPSTEPTNIPFLGGYSYTNPFNSPPFSLNQATGQLTFTPNAIGEFVFAILIIEYSQDESGLMGKVKSTEMRDYQFVIRNCSGPGPNATGPNFSTTTYNFYACYNEPFCFDILGVGDGADTNFLTYNGEIDTSTSPLNSFTIIKQNADSTVARFCWDPGTFVGTEIFTVTSTLDVCPYKRIGTFTYSIIIDTNFNPICKDTTVYLDSNGLVIIDSSFVWNTSVSNPCDIASIVIDKDSFLCADVGVNVVTVTTTYTNGIVRICTSNVTVRDTIDPSIICNSATLYLDPTGQLIVDTNGLIFSLFDNCGLDSVWVKSSDTLLGCIDTGIYNATIYVRDASGNMDSCVSTLTILDTIAPNIVCQPATLYLDALGQLIVDTNGLIVSTGDNCGVDSVWVKSSDTLLGCIDTGIYNATIYIMDGSGNIDSCVSSLTILDTVAPTIVCQPATLYLDALGQLIIDTTGLIASTSDNCGVDSVWVNPNDTLFGCADTGLYNATIYIMDVSGNIDSCVSVLTIVDSVRPQPLCRDTTIYLDITGNFIIDSSYINNGSNDACGIASITLSRYTFSCADTGQNGITLYVRDFSGNTDSCSAIVTVLDTINPTITCLPATLYLDALGQLVIDTSGLIGSLNDNCGIDSVWLNSNDTSYGCADTGLYFATLYVMDLSGNIDSCVSTLTILDTVAPSISCLPATLYLNALGQLVIDTSGLISSISDNCGVDSVWLNSNDTSFNCADTGLYNATIYVRDASGNMDSCVSVLTIIDSVRPQALCRDTTIYLDLSGNYTIDSSYIDNGSNDACGIASITLSRYTFTCFDTGYNTVTLYATDFSGNVDSCSAIVRVIDTIGPIAVCVDTTIYLDAFGNFSIDSSFVDGGSNDACGVFVLSQSDFTCAHVGPNNVTLYVYDGNNNVDSCTAIVTVLDTISPTAICRDTTLYLDSTGQIIIDSSFLNNNSFDNCAIATITISRDTFNCIDTGLHLVTMIVTDVNGNIDSCISQVIIRDTIFPPANAGMNDSLCGVYTYALNANNPPGTFVGTWVVLGAPNVPIISNVNNPFATISNLMEGQYTLEWSVTNGPGCNVVRDTMSIFVYDPPVSNVGNDTALCNQFSLGLSANMPAGLATGLWSYLPGCPTVPVFAIPNHPNSVVSNLDEGTYYLVWTVRNGSCPPARDTLRLDIFEQPTSTAGADQSQCGRQNALLLANTPMGTASGLWTLDPSAPNPNTPNILSPTNPVTFVSGLVEGTYRFVWTVSNGVCNAARDTMVLNVYDSVNAQAGTDTNLCGIYSLQLYGNAPVGTATGRWIVNPLSTPPSTPVFADSSVYNTMLTNLVEGTYRLLWVHQNGVCPNSVDSITIRVWDNPASYGGADSSLCSTYSIMMWASPISGLSQGSWTLDPTASNPNVPNIANPNQYNTAITGLIEGSYRFVWHVTNGPCYDYYDTVRVNIYDQPAAIVGPDQNLCDQPSTIISAVPVTGTSTGTWYLANGTPNIPVFNPNTPTTTVNGLQEAGTYVLYFEAVNGVCPVARDTITINNYPIPVADFTQDTLEICQNDCVQFTDLSTIHASDNIVGYYWYADNQVSTLPNPQFCFPYAGVADVQLIVESTHGCRDTLDRNNYITIYNLPIANFEAYLIDDEKISTKIQIQDQSIYSNHYWYSFGDGDTSNLQNPQHTYYDSGFYDITQIVTNNFGCADTIVKTIYVHILTVYVPNAFTPDGDQFNQGFVPVVNGDDPTAYLFRVFNRWGELIFQTQLKDDPWDGTFEGFPCKTDTYIWTLKTKYKDGDREFFYRGHVNLLR